MSAPSNCRSCGSSALTEVLSLGDLRISDFRDDPSQPPRYPLTLIRCEDCFLVQLSQSVPRPDLYHERYGFKSQISKSVWQDLRDVVAAALRHQEQPHSWLDIGCNDGTLLGLVPLSCQRIGIDPVKHLLAEGFENKRIDCAIHGYFDSDRLSGRKVDIITSVSMFYDVDEINDFVVSAKRVLAENGVWIIQQNYLGSMIENGGVDNICHEHVTYFSLRPLELLLNRHGLSIVEAEVNAANGGSLRTVVRHTHNSTPLMEELLPCDLEALERFANQSKTIVSELGAFVRSLVEAGKSVYVLGASTRGSTLWQAAGLDTSHLAKAVERNPAKVGRYYSAIGCPIISEQEARDDHPGKSVV